jgi:hypothetical protein
MVQADSANGAAPANYRLLLGVVIFLGVMIILTAGLLIAGLILGWGRDRPAQPSVAAQPESYLTQVPAPATGWISEAALDGGLLAVRIDGGGETGGAIVVIEAETGEIIGRVELDHTP